MAKRSVEIFTDNFFSSHAKQPKGGRGWMFSVIDSSPPKPIEVAVLTAPTDLGFLAAKAWARGEVLKNWSDELDTGFLYLEVAP